MCQRPVVACVSDLCAAVAAARVLHVPAVLVQYRSVACVLKHGLIWKGSGGWTSEGESDSIMLSFIYPDVMKSGVWWLFQDIHDPKLQKLADSLLLTVLHSRETSSTRKHLRAFKHWRTWAREHKVPAFLSQPHHVHVALSTASS